LTANDEASLLNMLALAAGDMSEDDFAAWIRGNISSI